jgi:hypothetical protein
MRSWCIISILMVASSIAILARKEETVEEMKARVDSTKAGDKVELCLKIAERQLEAANKLYSEGNVDQAKTDVQDVVTYSEKARDAATESGKKLKKAEISVRKMANKMRDLKRTLNFDDQAPVQEAIDHLEHVRTDLLARMFGSGK